MKLFLPLLLFLLVSSSSAKERWTIGLSTTSNFENAKRYVDKSANKYRLTINKINNNKFHINYGNYKTYNEAKKDMRYISYSGAYIRKIDTVQKWTIGLSTVSNYKNALSFIKKVKLKEKDNLSIQKSGRKFLVNYGVYDSLKDAKSEMKKIGLRGTYPRKTLVERNFINKSSLVKSIVPVVIESFDMEETKDKKEVEVLDSDIEETNTNSKAYKIENQDGFYPLTQLNQMEDKSFKDEKNYSYISLVPPKEPLEPQTKDMMEDDKFTYDDMDDYVEENEERELTDEELKLLYPKKQSAFGVELKYSPITLMGDFRFGTTGTKVDYEENLGYEDAANSFSPNFYYRSKNHKGFINFNFMEYTGQTVLDSDIQVNNYTYSSGQSLNSNIETTLVNGGYRYNLYGFDVGVDYLGFLQKTTLKDSINTTELELDYSIYALALDKEHNLNDYLISYGFKYGMGTNISLYDVYLSAGLKNFLIDDSSISLGYQSKVFDISDDIYEGELQFGGVFINLNKEF